MNKHIKVELDFIPVEERLPERAKTVLILYGNDIRPGHYVATNQAGTSLWHSNIDDRHIYNVTYWAESLRL